MCSAACHLFGGWGTAGGGRVKAVVKAQARSVLHNMENCLAVCFMCCGSCDFSMCNQYV
jgi:hypothetical protein